MASTRLLAVIALCVGFAAASPLMDLYRTARDKTEDAMEDKLDAFLNEAVPAGIRATVPLNGEWETFKQGPEVMFFHDGRGKLHFRQFRRLNLNSIMRSHRQ